jgi:hypothetical protein
MAQPAIVADCGQPGYVKLVDIEGDRRLRPSMTNLAHGPFFQLKHLIALPGLSPDRTAHG